jgi:DNA repair photolyase
MKTVISASRRVDMLNFYSERLINSVLNYGMENIHTLVIWTKNPEKIYKDFKIRELIEKLDQTFLLLTITGLGGSPLEPGVPSQEKVFFMLPHVIKALKIPLRINIRYDPLLDLKYKGQRITNIDLEKFKKVAEFIGKMGISVIRVSNISLYSKVLKRFKKLGITIFNHDIKEIEDFIKEKMMPVANELGVEIKTCTYPDITEDGCIDGKLLSSLHPQGEICSQNKDKSQRESCHCTKSIDIGKWYSCLHGCLYCYGSPRIESYV